MARTITVTLTEAQYGALMAAISLHLAHLELDTDYLPAERGAAVALDNAWLKINDAWNGRARG